MTRKGKIARLPRKFRDQLNRRLSENQDGGVILKWLNQLPAMKTIVANEFDGVPISKQNLSEWRNGGFAEWQTRQETLEQARELAADAQELTEITKGQLTDHLATVLAARYAALLSGWNGEEDEAFNRKLHILRSLSRDIIALRRSDQQESRLKMEKIRLDREEEKTEEEVVEQFQRWVETDKVREVILKDHMSPADRDREFRRIFGLDQLEESDESESESEFKPVTAEELDGPQPVESESPEPSAPPHPHSEVSQSEETELQRPSARTAWQMAQNNAAQSSTPDQYPPNGSTSERPAHRRSY